VVRLVERQPPEWPRRASGPQIVATAGERARDLIARRLFLARDLGVCAAAAYAFQQPTAEARGDADAPAARDASR
jgi:hypothetical protein